MSGTRERLINEIFEDMLIIRCRLIERRDTAPPGPTIPPAQGRILHVIERAGPLSIKEIAEIMRVSGSAITQLVDPLVKAGLLLREADKKDRRTLRISLTAEGGKRLDSLKKVRLESTALMLQPLNEAELETYRDLQRKIIGDGPKGSPK